MFENPACSGGHKSNVKLSEDAHGLMCKSIQTLPRAGVVHADLKLFLETNLPSGGKSKPVLGVSDAKIGAALQEELQLSLQTGGVVAEIIRGESAAARLI